MSAPLGYNSHNYYPEPPNYNLTFFMIITFIAALGAYVGYLHSQINELKQLCSG